jgi:Zn-dependent protease with chaperone function
VPFWFSSAGYSTWSCGRVGYGYGARDLYGIGSYNDRQLLNVVDEMALAAGMVVPPVYVLDDEKSINAFAAAFTPDDAVIGVNRGTLEYLTRDELQGVIAHEFSHISC